MIEVVKRNNRQYTQATTKVMRRLACSLHVLLLIGILLAFAAPSQAQHELSQRAIDRADRFLSTDQRAQATLNFVHFGTDYRRQEYRRTMPLGQGRFALVYRLYWNDDGFTDIEYSCDPNGAVREAKVDYTNASFNEPFLWAKASIQILGNLIIAAFQDKLTDNDRKQLQKLVDDADPKAMLNWSLQLDQLLSGK